MRFVVFGLSVSSSWGNGHATLWRGLVAALARAGHHVTFLERDQPWYAAHRDLHELPGGELVLYRDPAELRPRAAAALARADVALATSYCPDGPLACAWILDSRAPIKAFYDLDPGATLELSTGGRAVPWLGPGGLRDFDLVLSFTGGRALDELAGRLGARRVVPLYGFVDPEVHHPAPPAAPFRGDLSYLGTYAPSRQAALAELFLRPAVLRPDRRFVLAGSMYGAEFPWGENVRWVRHLEPALHPSFFCSSALTLSVTRAEMKALGHCPSGRLFEAAACGVPVVSDAFDGLDRFFTPGDEVLVAERAEDVLAALDRPAAALARIGARARARALEEHTAAARVRELLAACASAPVAVGGARAAGVGENRPAWEA